MIYQRTTHILSTRSGFSSIQETGRYGLYMNFGNNILSKIAYYL